MGCAYIHNGREPDVPLEDCRNREVVSGILLRDPG